MLHQLIKKFVLLLPVLLVYSCEGRKENAGQSMNSANKPEVQYAGEVVKLGNNPFYAYQIKKDGKTVIKQSFLPAVEGKVFIEDSLLAIRLMQKSLDKISQGQFPPSLSVQEVNNCVQTQN